MCSSRQLEAPRAVTDSITPDALARHVRESSAAQSPDPFVQARFLAECGFLVGAAATAQAAVATWIREKLETDEASEIIDVGLTVNSLLNVAAEKRLIGGTDQNRIRGEYERLSPFVHGRGGGVEMLLSAIGRLAEHCSSPRSAID